MLDLSIARLLQISRAIESRVSMIFKADAMLVEWSTRILAQFIAATTGKEGKALQKEAAKISLDFTDSKARADTDGEAPQSGTDDPAIYLEQGSQTAENKPGSMEALMRGLGG